MDRTVSWQGLHDVTLNSLKAVALRLLKPSTGSVHVGPQTFPAASDAHDSRAEQTPRDPLSSPCREGRSAQREKRAGTGYG